MSPAGSHFCRASCGRIWMNINRVTLQHNKEFIVIFLFKVISKACWQASEQAFGRAGLGVGKAKRPVDKHLEPPFHRPAVH